MIYRSLEDESELRDLWEFDHLSYGDAGLPWANFRAWWTTYPEGVHGAFSGDRVVGAVGMWPLLPDVYASMIRGRLAEIDLSPSSFDLSSSTRRHWYISGIVLREEWRRTGPIGALIFTAVERLCALAALERIDVCAIGSTNEGCRMLNRFGFVPYGPSTLDGHPVYVASDFVLDLALGENSTPASSPDFHYSPAVRRLFSSSEGFYDSDDLRAPR